MGDDDEFGDSGLDRFYEDGDLGGVSITGPNGADEISGGTEADDVIYDRRTTALVVDDGRRARQRRRRHHAGRRR